MEYEGNPLTPPGKPTGGPPSAFRSLGDGALERHLCQVGGINRNYTSSSGTLYHIQVEDRGPVMDRLTDREVRRVNLIVYANYGEPNARIVHSHDYDFPDRRTQEHNRFVEGRVQEIASDAQAMIEEKEQRQVFRIKCLIRDYYRTKDEATKREFADANLLYPFLFSRAFRELKAQRGALPITPAEPAAGLPPASEGVEAVPEEVIYPLDAELRERVMEIERIIIELGQDLHRLRRQGGIDDILMQTCRKLVARAKDSLSGREPSDYNARRLDMMRNSLLTTWRQVRSRIK